MNEATGVHRKMPACMVKKFKNIERRATRQLLALVLLLLDYISTHYCLTAAAIQPATLPHT
jgi:hypothetical protein